VSAPSTPLPLTFCRPSLEFRAAFEAWRADWRDGDPNYDAYRWIFARAWNDFDWYVTLCHHLRREGHPPELAVPLDAHWAFCGEALVGELYLFYEPVNGDNHIGYKVRPSYRRRGIATALLQYGLERMREYGIPIARLTCRDTNLASAAVIERAGGVRLEDSRSSEGHLIRRYAVPASPASTDDPP